MKTVKVFKLFVLKTQNSLTGNAVLNRNLVQTLKVTTKTKTITHLELSSSAFSASLRAGTMYCCTPAAPTVTGVAQTASP
jgi:hypothetical protein